MKPLDNNAGKTHLGDDALNWLMHLDEGVAPPGASLFGDFCAYVLRKLPEDTGAICVHRGAAGLGGSLSIAAQAENIAETVHLAEWRAERSGYMSGRNDFSWVGTQDLAYMKTLDKAEKRTGPRQASTAFLPSRLIEQLLEVGRLFVDVAENRMSRDHIRTAQPYWYFASSVSGAVARLGLKVNADWWFRTADGAFAVDLARKTVSHIAVATPGVTTRWIAMAPPLPVDEAKAAWSALKERGVELPEVPSFTVEDHGVLTPRAILRLLKFSGRSKSTQEIVTTPVARLEFDYGLGGAVMTAGGIAESWQGSVLHRFKPNSAFEIEKMHVADVTMAKIDGKRTDTGLFVLRTIDGDVAGRWLSLQSQVESLAASGIELQVDPGFPYKVLGAGKKWHLRVVQDDKGTRANIEAGGLSHGQIYDAIMSLWESADFREEAKAGNRATWYTRIKDDTWAAIDTARAAQMLTLMVDLDRCRNQNFLPLSRFDAARLNGVIAGDAFTVDAPRDFLALHEQLAAEPPMIQGILPDQLVNTMRPFQTAHVRRSILLRDLNIGTMFCDKTGLGKTLQTLAHLLYLKVVGRARGKFLLVVPVNALTQWVRQAEKFGIALNMVELSGGRAERRAMLESNKDADAFLISHKNCLNDHAVLSTIDWDTLVVDEMHHARKHTTAFWRALKSLRAINVIGATATPMHNTTMDLWSLSQLVTPGLWPSREWFKERFKLNKPQTIDLTRELDDASNEAAGTPVVDEASEKGRSDKAYALGALMGIFMLRLPPALAAREKPPVDHIVEYVRLDREQAALYETTRRYLADAFERDVALGREVAQNAGIVLASLVKLRQVCCHPGLVSPALRSSVSAKLDTLVEKVTDLRAEGSKVIVSSSFTEMLKLIEERLGRAGFSTAMITGETGGSRARAKQQDKFASADCDVMLLAMKAGGEAIDLVEADTVIHFEPWYNPMAIEQVIGRASRMSQTADVTSIIMIVEGSIEEQIQALADAKRQDVDSVMDGAEAASGRLTVDDLRRLLAPLSKMDD